MFRRAALLLAALVCISWQSPPQQFTTSGAGSSPDVAANSTGNALAVWVDSGAVKGSLFTNGNWGASAAVSSNTGTNSASKVAYDDSGKGLAIWVASSSPTNSVHSAFFNGTTWSEPSISPLDSSTNAFTSPSIAMDGMGNGLSAWIELGVNEVRSSSFSFSFWALATTIGTGDGTVSIAFSQNEKGVAVWTNGNVATANQFQSGSWQTATVIGEVGDSEPEVGIDSNGNAHAIWLLEPAGSIMTATFNGTSWSAPQEISAGSGNINPHIAVAPGGTAVATWIDSSNAVQSSTFDGNVWSAPKLISNSPQALKQDVAVASNGNALALWITLMGNQIESSALPLNGNWDFQQTVGTFATPPSGIRAAFSSSGAGFAVWEDDNNAFGSFTPAIIPPSPPRSIKGKVRNNSSATQVDRLHIITFKPSTDTTVIFYRLRRNGKIIAEIPLKGPFEYIDHNRCVQRKDVYTLTAVSAGGLESTPLVVELK